MANAIAPEAIGFHIFVGSIPTLGTMNKTKQPFIRIIPLGGLGEVGRNMTLLEYKNDIIVIDVGAGFPTEDMPGIDTIIPNISYLKQNRKKVKGVVITHGHYDHIGAVPYIMDQIGNPPIYTSKLTKGMILRRQEEFPNKPKLKIRTVQNGDQVKIGPFKVEFFRQNHSIPKTHGLFIKSPAGNILHTADFKFDKNPVNDKPTDFKKIKNFGKEGVDLLFSDSTGAEGEGHSLSEKVIEENLADLFKKLRNQRIIASTFSSLLNRIQQLITLSEKNNRKVIISGYSMKTNVEIAKELGYLTMKKGTLINAKEAKNYEDKDLTVICTGAQGEERAALMKLVNDEHRFLKLKKNDTVILSSSVVPGNEKTVQSLKDDILRTGADVYDYNMLSIHASGHARREELKKMLDMVKPKYFIPVHGQYSMLVRHLELARKWGIKKDNGKIIENGQIAVLNEKGLKVEKKTVPSSHIMIDGSGVGDVGKIVLRDRHTLGKNGMFVVIATVDKKTGKIKTSPDIISRGFVYLRESKDLLHQTRKKIRSIVRGHTKGNGPVNWKNVKKELRNKLSDYLYQQTKRRPMVLPVIIEV